MGVALLLNQGVATCIAAVFLPTVGHLRLRDDVLAWAPPPWVLPVRRLRPARDQGRTLEDIEQGFAGTTSRSR